MTNDTQLQSNVESELKWRPSINAAHIGVTASNGVITLSGQVDNYSQKLAAEDAAKAVYGVKGVANDIEVVLPLSSKRTDQDVAQAVLGALKWNYDIPADRIQVTVRQGLVSLEGTVDWQYQKDAAARAVRYLNGVIAVTNQIKVTPSVKWIDVKNDIRDAFKRKATLEASRIDVATRQGEVTLSGTVSSWAERNEAVDAAWAAPGVAMVKDQLSIVP